MKHVWGVRGGGELIAVADLLQGHPDVRDWYIGLLLIDPAQQQNTGARSFWERQGFEIESEALNTSGRLRSQVWILVRRTRALPHRR